MLKVILFSPNGYVGSHIREKIVIQDDIKLFEITRKSDVGKVEGDYDILVYSASVTSERNADVVQYIMDNALCAVTMVKFCREHNVKKIIYLSTDEIYGQIYAEQVNENVVMHSPNIYAVTKYLAEKTIMDSGIGYYILRLPGIVGGRWGGCFIYRLMDVISRDEKVVLYHSDKDFNNVVDIDDLTDFITKLIYHRDYAKSEVFLLGNMEKINLLVLVKYIQEIFHSHSEIVCMEKSNGRYFTLDVEKAVNYGYQSKSIKQIVVELSKYKLG